MKTAAWLLVGLLAAPSFAAGDAILEAHTNEAFPEAMLRVQDAIIDHGYVISRVQRVDFGLTQSGFNEEGRYRIVFFGRPQEIRRLAEEHPRLIPFLPLKITLSQAENETETMVLALDPRQLAALYPDPALAPVFARWRADLRSILAAADRRHARRE
ncbi:MAG: DUF302 domain-containing protein [Gammaproteobacteria bacterium]|nr:DUF302 domain-containing protein [Gammaproteobacteria bacterium]